MARPRYRRIGDAILDPNGMGIGSPRVAGEYAQDPECDAACDTLCELANAGTRLILLCRELDTELDGMRLSQTTAAIVNGIRRVLDEIEPN